MTSSPLSLVPPPVSESSAEAADRLAAELVTTKTALEDALQIGNEAGARIDVLQMERDNAIAFRERALQVIAAHEGTIAALTEEVGQLRAQYDKDLADRTLERDAARETLVLEGACARLVEKQKESLVAVVGRVQIWLAEDGYAADERSRAALRSAFLDAEAT